MLKMQDGVTPKLIDQTVRPVERCPTLLTTGYQQVDRHGDLVVDGLFLEVHRELPINRRAPAISFPSSSLLALLKTRLRTAELHVLPNR